MRKHWMWSLGIVVCLVPILAAQEIYKEMILLSDRTRQADPELLAAEETASECPHAGTQCGDEKTAVPNPQEVARQRQEGLNLAVAEFNAMIEKGEYEKAREVARRVIETMPEHPVATLMWSRIQGIEKQQVKVRPVPGPKTAEPAKDWNQLTEQRQRKQPQPIKPGPSVPELVTVTYPVADLVIPTPKKVTLCIDGEGSAKPEKTPAPEYDSLLKLIQESVAPASWTEAGGQASLQPYETTLSLVVRQTQDAHEQIDDLLTALRRLQDVQLVYEIRVLSLPEDDNWLAEYNKASRADLNWDAATQTLNPKQTAQLVQQAQSSERGNILFAPKVTLYNGQVLDLQLGDAGLLKSALMHGVISDDRRTIRLNTALNCASVEDVVAATVPTKLADGSSVLLNPHLTQESVRTVHETPILNQVPYVSRLFKNSGISEKSRVVVLVTPRIFVQEEEEELLNATFPLPGGDQSNRQPEIIPASGQTTPSREYLQDDIQYFPTPALKLPAPLPPQGELAPLPAPPQLETATPAAPEPANEDVRYFLGMPR